MRNIGIATVLAFACGVGQAADDESRDRPVVSPAGRASYTMLQFVKTSVPPDHSRAEDSTSLSGSFLHMVDGEVGLRARIRRVCMQAGFTSHIWHKFEPYNVARGRVRTAGISELRVDLALGGTPDEAPFNLTAGYFNFQYAPEALDLGEYLFTAGVHPGYILSKKLSSGGRYGADLFGLQLRTTIVPNLVLDGFFTSENFVIPTFDFSPALLVHYSAAGGAVTIGAGLMATRLFSVNRHNTTPDSLINVTTNSAGDTVSRDTVWFTHRGGKAMARVVFDPKLLFGALTRLGTDDLKLYAEAALLGFKNYPIKNTDPGLPPLTYSKLRERIPVMVGLHLPAFGLLDVCAVEVEWYGSPHKNDPDNKGYAYPEFTYTMGSRDDWRWALLGRKTILDHFTITGRAACDHLRIPDGTGWFESPYERFEHPSQWYWAVEFLFSF